MVNIVECLRALPDFYPGNSSTEKDIHEAEAKLGVTFSDEYRDYVHAYGDASANGHELTGISDSARINVVSVTLAERARNPSVPEELYVVEQTGIDRIVVWQDSKGTIYQTIPGCVPEKLCVSLSEYIAR